MMIQNRCKHGQAGDCYDCLMQEAKEGVQAIAKEVKYLRLKNQQLQLLNQSLVATLSEVLDTQSAKESPSIHQWGRWRMVYDAALKFKTE